LLSLLAVGGFFAVRALIARRPLLAKQPLPAGYIAESNALKQEYFRYYGAPLNEPVLLSRFQQAADAAAKGSLAGAASSLEDLTNVSRRTPVNASVPVVFHDLGLTYASLGDTVRAAAAFREVLARDWDYAPTRKFLHDSKSIAVEIAEPFARELEPNNDAANANLMSVRAPVGGEIAGTNDPADYFKVITPGAPRDLVSIELANHSIDFAPTVRIFDGDLRILSWGEKTARAGESITLTGGPKPNSVLYIAVTAADANGGLYLLSVNAKKAFDKHEPNDDLSTSKRISVGEEVAASVMDAGDSDFFSFQSPRRGTITIEIHNRSNTLIPALTMYNGDRRNMGFAQEVRKPGSDIRYLLDADQSGLYYVQVSSQAGTAGDYSLRVD